MLLITLTFYTNRIKGLFLCAAYGVGATTHRPNVSGDTIEGPKGCLLLVGFS